MKSSGKAKAKGTPDSVPSEQEGPESPLSQAKSGAWAGGELRLSQPLDSQSSALPAQSVHLLGLQEAGQAIFSGLGVTTT